MEYFVTATINGKRIKTDKGLFKSKKEASIYAKATNVARKGANARVVKE